MNFARSITPEAMWGDATSKSRDYAALSRQYATRGDALGAVHALWASDMATVQTVIWERVMVASPQPDEQFFAITKTVAKALLNYGANTRPAQSALECVAAAREGLAAAFDPAALRVVGEKMASIEHLADLPAPDAQDLSACAGERLSGRTCADMVTERKHAARDGIAVALAMYGEGRLDDAQQQAWMADWAAFEAYLVEAAAAIGDEALVSVDLRWELAVATLAEVPTLPFSFIDAVQVIRERMLGVVGPVEANRLRDYFTPLSS